MKRILVTSSSHFTEELNDDISVDYVPFVRVETYNKNQILEQIPQNSESFIITSKHAARAIQDIDLDGDFYVVGKNTAKELRGQNRNVKFVTNYAEDLLEKMLDSEVTDYIFFKGNLSLNTIPRALEEKQIKLTQIECYQTSLAPKTIDPEVYDAIIFMSPSAVRSFFSKNQLKPNTLIFTIGKTTAKEIDNYGDYNVFYPEETTHEALIELINDKLKINA